eukprot:5487926-Pleurochrysis_carterae.AAC.1
MHGVAQRPIVERAQDKGGALHQQRLHLVRRADGPLLEQVRVVTYLAQLHEYVHDTQHRAGCEGTFGLGGGHEVFVQVALSPRERARHHVLDFAWQRLLHVLLEPAEEEGPQDGMQPVDHVLVHSLRPLDHAGNRRRAWREKAAGGEDGKMFCCFIVGADCAGVVLSAPHGRSQSDGVAAR